MLSANVPARFPIPWGASAGAGYIRAIPEASQVGVQAGAASLTDGFPPVTFLPVGAGGTPPFGSDFNGILNQVTLWNQWQAAGGPVVYDGTFSASIGGYPKGAVLIKATLAGVWVSGVDGNSTDPEAAGAGWSGYDWSGIATTGDTKWRPTEETVPGWAKANATTVGNASSNATQLASAIALDLFVWLWTNFSNTACPVYTSAGVLTTRGASAAADWAANKAIATLDMRGTSPIGMDTMGGATTTRLAGVPVTSGAANLAGSILGENFHSLTAAENGSHNHAAVSTVYDPTHGHTGTTNPGGVDHTHPYQRPAAQVGVYQGNTFTILMVGADPWNTDGASAYIHQHTFATAAAATGITVGTSIINSGSGTAHNTVQRSMTGTWYVKL